MPCAPSWMYMRVLPSGSSVTASSGRVVVTPGLSDALISVQVAPPSFERQTPREYEPAYTISGSLGSSAIRRTPRGEQGVRLFASSTSPVQGAVVLNPLWMKLQVAPPSV